MQRKNIDTLFDVKKIQNNGVFEGYASVFNDVDSVKDKVINGAFKNSLNKYRIKNQMPAMLWQHDAKEPIGVWREIFEDKKGLYVKGELFINEIPRAKQAYKLMREGGLSGLSIGFKTVESDLNHQTGERNLREVDLVEISMVTFPALDSARIVGVKELLGSGELPDIRNFENFLRDAGFSRKQSKGIISKGYKTLLQREVDDDELDILMSISRLSDFINPSLN